jgi:hypothetical protein
MQLFPVVSGQQNKWQESSSSERTEFNNYNPEYEESQQHLKYTQPYSKG